MHSQKHLQSRAEKCENCHLNSSCFDYDENLWYPTKCKTKLFHGKDAVDCLKDKTFCLVGDSRLACPPKTLSILVCAFSLSL